MLIKLIVVGKTVKSYLKEGESIFEGRLQHYTRFEEIVIPELKNAAKLSLEEIKKKEGEQILKKIDNSDLVILLDDKGKEKTSIQFSQWIEKNQISGTKTAVFIIGGAYGFSAEVYQRAQQKLSLSKMTFSHQMVRLIFKEQLYRAFSILRNEPYHHE